MATSGSASIGMIVLGRLDSKRLPGKVLKPVAGKPLLWYVLARCQQVAAIAPHIIVATSDRPVDDPIAEYCCQLGVKVFRGSAENVAERVLACALENRLERFFRINADSPFAEPQLLQQACSIVAMQDYDLVTNLYPRSFPYGVSVELIRTRSFETAYSKFTEPGHFEHVTQFFYQNLSDFSYYNIMNDGENLSQIRLTVDTEEDFQFFKSWIERSPNHSSLSYSAICSDIKNQ